MSISSRPRGCGLEREEYGGRIVAAALANRLAYRVFSEARHNVVAVYRYIAVQSVSAPLFPLIEERLRRLEVEGVESFGELGV